jgi:C4-type Zn-finger protein
MSIKIIKNTMNEPIEITCPICESVFSYTFDEVRREDRYNFLGLKDGVKRFIICPVCKSDINMSPKVNLEEEVNL